MGNEFGKHSQLTFVNGSYTEPIDADNLNEMERMIEITDNELARSSSKDFSKYKEYFFNRNCKQIDDFQDNTDWTADSSTTLSDDTTNKFIGNNSIKCAENDAVASYVGMYKTVSAIDLTKFNDESASGIYDCIALAFYISDYTKVNTVVINLGTDSSNYYYVAYGSFTKDGWQTIYPMKDDFTATGSPDWSAITYIRIRWYSETGASGEYISPQIMSLFRTDALYGTQYYNPFQKYKGSVSGWENYYNIAVDAFFLAYDPIKCDIGLIMGTWYEQYYNNRSLRILQDTISFVSEFEIICKRDDEGPSITWWYDNNNYLMAYVESNRLYIKENVGGSPTTSYVDFDTNIYYNNRYNLFVEKNGDTFRAIIKKNGESTKVLEYETTINSEYDGDVYIGHEGTLGPGLITDFKVTNTEVFNQDAWSKPMVVFKEEDQDDSSTTIGNDLELYIWLPPNGLYEVEANLFVDGTDAATDFKTDWDVTGIEAGSYYRNCLGPGTGSTSNYNCPAMEVQTHAFTTAVNYGIVASGYSRIVERSLCKTGNTGGLITIRHAAANAGTVTVKAGSYIKATQVKKW